MRPSTLRLWPQRKSAISVGVAFVNKAMRNKHTDNDLPRILTKATFFLLILFILATAEETKVIW